MTFPPNHTHILGFPLRSHEELELLSGFAFHLLKNDLCLLVRDDGAERFFKLEWSEIGILEYRERRSDHLSRNASMVDENELEDRA